MRRPFPTSAAPGGSSLRLLRRGPLLQPFPRHRQHQLNPVLLVDPGSAGIIVNGRDVGLGIEFPDTVNHALSADMIGQTSERLCADNILIASPDQLHHLGSQQPSLSHFVAPADDAVGQLRQLPEGERGVETIFLQGADHRALPSAQCT